MVNVNLEEFRSLSAEEKVEHIEQNPEFLEELEKSVGENENLKTALKEAREKKGDAQQEEGQTKSNVLTAEDVASIVVKTMDERAEQDRIHSDLNSRKDNLTKDILSQNPGLQEGLVRSAVNGLSEEELSTENQNETMIKLGFKSELNEGEDGLPNSDGPSTVVTQQDVENDLKAKMGTVDFWQQLNSENPDQHSAYLKNPEYLSIYKKTLGLGDSGLPSLD